MGNVRDIYTLSKAFTQDVRVTVKLVEKTTKGWLGSIILTSPETSAFLVVEASVYNHVRLDADEELLQTAKEYIYSLQEKNPWNKFTLVKGNKVRGTYFPRLNK